MNNYGGKAPWITSIGEEPQSESEDESGEQQEQPYRGWRQEIEDRFDLRDRIRVLRAAASAYAAELRAIEPEQNPRPRARRRLDFDDAAADEADGHDPRRAPLVDDDGGGNRPKTREGSVGTSASKNQD